MTDPRLLTDVKAAEGCRLTAYKDTNGYWTIGYGHKLDPSIDWEGQEWTQETADAQLAADIDEAAEQAQHLPEAAGLDQCRANALIELVFNMGLGTWRTFDKCRRALGAGDWTAAADQLLQSKWAKEVGVERSQRLARYIWKGIY